MSKTKEANMSAFRISKKQYGMLSPRSEHRITDIISNLANVSRTGGNYDSVDMDENTFR